MSEQIKINNFSGGMGSEIGDKNPNKFWYAENVDVGENDYSLKQIVNNQSENTNYTKATNILKMIQVGSNFYGLGQENASTHDTTIFKKSDLTSAWAAAPNGTITATDWTAVNGDPMFVSDGTYIYLMSGGAIDAIAQYTIGGGGSMNATWSSTQPDAVLNGGVVGGDGQIYAWTPTSLYKLIAGANNTVPVGPAIPSDQTIVQCVQYQSYLAVICTSTSGKSKMFLWDYVDTVYFAERADIGFGTVTGGEVVNGVLQVVVNLANGRGFKIKDYSGEIFQTLYTYVGRYNRAQTGNYGFAVSRCKSYSGFLYFIAMIARPDSTVSNIYEFVIVRYGRKDTSKNYSFTIYKTLDYDFSEGAIGGLNIGKTDFLVLENLNLYPDIKVFAVLGVATDVSIFFESAATTFSAQAGVIETFIFDGDDASITKQLVAVSVQYSPLPVGGAVVCKYKKDAETTWTTIFNDTSNTGTISHESSNIESTGGVLPYFKNIQFRIELTGGAELTGMKFKYNPTTNLYG